MKRLIAIAVLAFAALASAFAEKFIAIDTNFGNEYIENHGVHYVIDDRVNVRDEPNLSGSKLFQLNAGDKVTIIDFSWEWDFHYAEGYSAPWYKIESSKGTGYICGRYVSSKQVVGDIDNDGRDEIFACLCVNDWKGAPIAEYMGSFKNINENHVIIKNGIIKKVDLESLYSEPISEDAGYKIVEGNGLTPKVNFLVVKTGIGDGGGMWSKDKYFYFDRNGKLKFFEELNNSAYEMDSENKEEFIFNGKTVKHVRKYTEWKDMRELPTQTTVKNYSWDGENFTPAE